MTLGPIASGAIPCRSSEPVDSFIRMIETIGNRPEGRIKAERLTKKLVGRLNDF